MQSWKIFKQQKPRRGFLNIPIAILIAGVIIAVAVIYASSNTRGNLMPQQPAEANLLEVMRPVDNSDHIRGNPDAPIKIVEFSDISCPACQAFHPVMQKINEEYGEQIAWVYRHFPLEQHHFAAQQAEATECANELQGNDAFWNYLDILLLESPQNIDGLMSAAAEVGVDSQQLKECLDSDRHEARISRDYQDGVSSGISGTPHSVVILPSGETMALRGGQPLSAMKQIMETVLNSQ